MTSNCAGTVCNFGTTGVGESEHFGNLVEGFADSVVFGFAEDVIDKMIAHEDEFGVPARNDKGEERKYLAILLFGRLVVWLLLIDGG